MCTINKKKITNIIREKTTHDIIIMIFNHPVMNTFLNCSSISVCKKNKKQKLYTL